MASIPLGYLAGARIARRSGDGDDRIRLAALLTAAMVAVIPYGVRYGSETRMYSLLMLLVLAGYLLIDDLFRNRRSGGAPSGSPRSVPRWSPQRSCGASTGRCGCWRRSD